MALKDKLTASEYEAQPQALKDAGAYKPGPKAEDGAETWVLDSPEAAGLAMKLKAKDKTIEKLQRDAEAATKRLEDLEKRFEGIDPESARKAAETEAERERGDLLKKGDINAIVEREKAKWQEAQAKKDAARNEQLTAAEADLHKLLVRDKFRRTVTAGTHGEGKDEREIPVILPEYMAAAEAWYDRAHAPKVVIDEANGCRARRAVAMSDGIERDMEEHIRDEWLPTVTKIFCRQPQHTGGHTTGTKPSHGPAGSPRRILASDQAAINAGQDAIAKGKAIVVDG